jgi:Protein kinase domain
MPEDSPEAFCPACLRQRGPDAAAVAQAHTDTNPTGQPGPFTAPRPGDLARHFPQLEILELRGQGGMGAVYKARQVKLDRLVALKILPPEWGKDPAFAARFAREARALAKLSHPQVVAVHDFGDADGLYYLLMEYVDGDNLRQRLQAGRVPPREALAVVTQVCDALQYAHEEGVVHRDIKPENILLDRRGRVKIADFSLAKLLGRTLVDLPLTASQQVMGTWHYMAPEQIERPLQVDHRADIYSLGVVFYEMLTGGLPLGRFAMPSQKVAVDPRLDEVVLRALEKEPERRYQQAGEMRAAVEAATAGVPATAVAQVVTAPVPAPTLSGPEREAVRRRLGGPAFGLFVTGVIASLFWLVFGLLLFLMMTVSNREAVVNASIWVLVGLFQGVFLIGGARKMQKLEGHGFVVTSCGLAMVPVTPAVVIGLPVGIWALVLLGRPEVRAAFGVAGPAPRPARPGRPSWLWRLFTSTTGWAILCSALGLVLCLIPWSQRNDAGGLSTEPGIVVTVTFLALLAFLVATSFIEPVPVWRPPALIVSGLIVLLFMALYFRNAEPLSDAVPGVNYMVAGLGLALLFLGTLQLRGVLRRLYQEAAARAGPTERHPSP